jgi:hypothetical protein
MKLLPDWLHGCLAPASSWPVIQIEVTSRCQTRCVFCPRHWLKERWLHGDLAWDLYRDHIAPELDRFELVYLQGWGKPTLHPHLWCLPPWPQAHLPAVRRHSRWDAGRATNSMAYDWSHLCRCGPDQTCPSRMVRPTRNASPGGSSRQIRLTTDTSKRIDTPVLCQAASGLSRIIFLVRVTE